jgi:putative transposase
VFLSNEVEQQRQWAIQRFLAGEKPESIYVSLGRTKAWLYKWLDRYEEGEAWYATLTRRPLTNPKQTASEVEEVVKLIRVKLYTNDLFCGAQAILWELEDLGIKPLPSMRTINRIISKNELIHRRTGRYVPRGKQYPKLPSSLPNQSHQADHVGPCYLKGPVRFYSLNVVDLATGRCGLDPALSKSGKCVTDGIWAIWKRLGMPDNIQIDNASSFYGSPQHPRGMGPLIRLCLFNKVEPWFIPVAEPGAMELSKSSTSFTSKSFLTRLKW